MRTMLAITLALMASSALAQTVTATGTFINAAGEEVGTITLTAMDESVHITGEVTGIPAGEHGVHFHEVGDCDATTQFESAEGHFNPGENQHGLENPEGPHAGDMTNQTASEDDVLTIDFHSPLVSLTEGAEGYLFDADGTALVVHADSDDQMTDPSGNSGDRIACAVIEAGPPAP